MDLDDVTDIEHWNKHTKNARQLGNLFRGPTKTLHTHVLLNPSLELFAFS